MSSACGGAYQDSWITGCEGEDVGAGDSAWAGSLESGLDLVDHLKPPEGVPVGVRPFLTDYAAAVVQQHGCITALHIKQYQKRLIIISQMWNSLEIRHTLRSSSGSRFIRHMHWIKDNGRGTESFNHCALELCKYLLIWLTEKISLKKGKNRVINHGTCSIVSPRLKVVLALAM